VTSKPHIHSHHEHPHPNLNSEPTEKTNGGELHEDYERLRIFLDAHFGNVTIPTTGEDDDWLVMDVKVDDVVARVDLISMVTPSFLSSARAC
jgi:hypothetical protein